jgi:hypothetical protein
MERRIITTNDFQSVARNNEYFLWHFVQKKQEFSSLGLFSYFKTKEDQDNKIKELLDLIDIPYFESYTEDSLDFLHGLGFSYDKLWTNKSIFPPIPNEERFHPVVIGFKKFSKKKSTQDFCYCVDGILEIISDLNPEFLITVNTED